MPGDEITNPRAGGPTSARGFFATKPSSHYDFARTNYGLDPLRGTLLEEPVPSEAYRLSLSESGSYGDFLSEFIQDNWLANTQPADTQI